LVNVDGEHVTSFLNRPSAQQIAEALGSVGVDDGNSDDGYDEYASDEDAWIFANRPATCQVALSPSGSFAYIMVHFAHGDVIRVVRWSAGSQRSESKDFTVPSAVVGAVLDFEEAIIVSDHALLVWIIQSGGTKELWVLSWSSGTARSVLSWSGAARPQADLLDRPGSTLVAVAHHAKGRTDVLVSELHHRDGSLWQVRTLDTGCTGYTRALAWSPDGSQLAVLTTAVACPSGEDGVAVLGALVPLAEGGSARPLRARMSAHFVYQHTSLGCDVAFSPDGRVVAMAGAGGPLIWEAGDGSFIYAGYNDRFPTSDLPPRTAGELSDQAQPWTTWVRWDAQGRFLLAFTNGSFSDPLLGGGTLADIGSRILSIRLE